MDDLLRVVAPSQLEAEGGVLDAEDTSEDEEEEDEEEEESEEDDDESEEDEDADVNAGPASTAAEAMNEVSVRERDWLQVHPFESIS